MKRRTKRKEGEKRREQEKRVGKLGTMNATFRQRMW